MLFLLALINLIHLASALVAREPVIAAGGVCKVGIYPLLAPLANYAPAQTFCATKYPNPVVTVTAKPVPRLAKRYTTTTTTTAPPATTPAATKCSNKDPLPCLFSSVKGEIAKTVSHPPKPLTRQPLAPDWRPFATAGSPRKAYRIPC